ncbi:MAG TPA: hypothetical protein VF571_07025 [Pyrinomonadaceae bacterium]|jgi:hypothetical protein
MEEKPKETKETESAANDDMLQVTFEIDGNIKTIYANEMAIQALHSEIVMSFFEVRLPLVQLGQPNTATAQCVGRIAMPLGKVPNIIDALETQFNKYMAKANELNKKGKERKEEETNDTSTNTAR